jgi:hypothetical protein
MRRPVPARHWITVPVHVPVNDIDGPALSELEQALDRGAEHADTETERRPTRAVDPDTRRYAWSAVSSAFRRASLQVAADGVDPYPASEDLPVGTVIATTDRVWIRGPERTDVQPHHQLAKHVWQPGDYAHRQIDALRVDHGARILRIGTGR